MQAETGRREPIRRAKKQHKTICQGGTNNTGDKSGEQEKRRSHLQACPMPSNPRRAHILPIGAIGGQLFVLMFKGKYDLKCF